MPLLRAEYRKLFTVRSTYILSILAALIISVLAFYAGGYKGVGPEPYWLSSIFENVANISLFAGLVGILLMGHEYRHNTIMYTLTSANSRTKVLLAKAAAITTFSAMLFVFIAVCAVLAYQLGVAFSPTAEFSPMRFFWGDIWRSLFFVVSYGLVGLLFAFLFRHLVGAIAALFVIPTVEQLATVLLKDNAQYLPFITLSQVQIQSPMSAGKAALLFSCYLVVGWLSAWYLFLRRDAN